MALLDVLSLFDAFLSESITRSIAAATTIVEELRIIHEGSSYPRMEAIMVSPTNGIILCASGASSIIIRKTLRAWTRHRVWNIRKT